MSRGECDRPTGVARDKNVTVNPNKTVCNACMILFPQDDLVQVRCKHQYCAGCLEFFFTRAMKDETLYPPACCQFEIPLRIAAKSFSMRFARRYKAKELELRTRNKTYCHRTACSAFIAPHSIHNGNAYCQRCGSITCARCKSAWHWGPCSQDDGTGFFELVRTAAWKQCPECKRVVERIDGCNHIT